MKIEYLLVLLTSVACNSGTGSPADDSSPPLEAKLSIVGGLLGESLQFDDIRGVTTDASGRIFVADHGVGRVHVLGATEASSLLLREPNSGGSLSPKPCCLSVDQSNRLWLADLGSSEYRVYSVDGEARRLLLKIRMPSPLSGRNEPILWNSAGHVAHFTTYQSPVTRQFGLIRAFVTTSGSVSRIDTLLDPAIPGASISLTRSGTLPGGKRWSGTTEVRQPFGPAVLRAFGPNGETAAAMTSRYQVEWTDGRGRSVARIDRNVDGPPTTRAERTIAEAMLKRTARDNKVSRRSIPFKVPRTKHPIVGLSFDREGRLWVERAVKEHAPHEADIYQRDGRLQATVRWPRDVVLAPSTAAQDSALGISGPIGTQQLVKLRFPKQPALH